MKFDIKITKLPSGDYRFKALSDAAKRRFDIAGLGNWTNIDKDSYNNMLAWSISHNFRSITTEAQEL